MRDPDVFRVIDGIARRSDDAVGDMLLDAFHLARDADQLMDSLRYAEVAVRRAYDAVDAERTRRVNEMLAESMEVSR